MPLLHLLRQCCAIGVRAQHPFHRQPVMCLGAHTDRAALAQQVQQWQASELEQAVIDAGGCAAEMRSAAAWQQHPQGQAVQREPLFSWQSTQQAAAPAWPLAKARQ